MAASSCSACVSDGCVFCKGSDFSGNADVCVCEGLNDGFFGGCSDFSFGADELSSKVDCTFERENGEVILGVVVVFASLFFFCVAACLYRRNSWTSTIERRNQAFSSGFAENGPDGAGRTEENIPVAEIVREKPLT